MVFLECLEGVLRVSGGCLDSVSIVSSGCLEVTGRYFDDVQILITISVIFSNYFCTGQPRNQLDCSLRGKKLMTNHFMFLENKVLLRHLFVSVTPRARVHVCLQSTIFIYVWNWECM